MRRQGNENKRSCPISSSASTKLPFITDISLIIIYSAVKAKIDIDYGKVININL